MSEYPTVVIGAGPYGLSVAAHLKGARVPTLIFGKPMEFWQSFPRGMNLRSAWSASSLSDPEGAYSLDRFRAPVAAPPPLPIPLPYFIDYGLWFQRHAVPDVDRTYVESLSKPNGAFRLELADGRTLEAGWVVVAAGINSFAHVPDFAKVLPESIASHSRAHSDLDRFHGASVAVIGGGQRAIEAAAPLYGAGPKAELIQPARDRRVQLHGHPRPGRNLRQSP